MGVERERSGDGVGRTLQRNATLIQLFALIFRHFILFPGVLGVPMKYLYGKLDRNTRCIIFANAANSRNCSILCIRILDRL